MTAWEPYKPSPANPWTLAKVGHLHRRAGFGATYAELQKGLNDGPDKTIDRILAGSPADPDFERTSDFTASERSLPSGTPGTQLAAWWLGRILKNPHPLREKLSLFWHNHFATSLAKVANARFMLGQYRLIYRHALGDFRNLLQEMSTDPAMMIWLDTTQSKKGKPNENYARELMELFALGIGHYSEADVREAAKAFTGYEVAANKAKFNASQHDDGEKTVLGRKGKWKPDDIVRICLDQPACPRFIARKLYKFLVSDAELPPAELIDPLATRYRESGFDTAKLVETILRSNHFFSAAAYRQKVKAPVDFAVGIVRGLEGAVGPLRLAESLESLGQALFAPPSVKGWDGGPTWLNGQTLLVRQNLALALTSTNDSRFAARCDPARLAKRQAKVDDEAIVDFFLEVFLQGDVPPESRKNLLDYMKSARTTKTPVYWTEDEVAHHRVRTAAYLAMTLPEYQLD